MKRKKIVITLLTIVTVIALMIGKSFAAGSFSASLTPNNSKVSKGSEVKVTLKLSGINVDGGINGLVGTLKFDTDRLTLSKADIKGLDGWTVTYNEENKKIEIDCAEAVMSDTEIATFTFKVSEKTTATSAAIQLVSISAANSTLDDPVKISDITTNIGIGTSIGVNNETPSTSNETKNETNNESSNTVRNSITGNTVSNNIQKGSNSTTVNNENIPYTGASNYLVPLMIAVLALSIISFVNYKRIEK